VAVTQSNKQRDKVASDQTETVRSAAGNSPMQFGRPQLGEAIAELSSGTAMQTAHAQLEANRTGLPDRLKQGMESLSGFSLNDVRVHRNSSEPAQLQAEAFARGSDIHLAPGKEHHLPHEAWHVVQQLQGRVRATTQMAGGTPVNDDAGLEREADVMGARAALFSATSPTVQRDNVQNTRPPVAQCVGHIRFANLAARPMYQEKAQAVIAGLHATPSIAAFLTTRDVLITLEFEPQLASVIVIGDQVQVTLSPWFFEQESRGRILGMLAHEFGVHPLADAAMTPAELAAENLAVAANTAFPTALPGHDIEAGRAGQQDHVFATVAGQPRFGHYRQTVFEMAEALLGAAQGPMAVANGVTEAHVTDLIMTYLSDLAIILATNDHRGRIVAAPMRTASLFNLERLRWLGSLNHHNPVEAELIRLTPGTKSGGNVLGEVRSLLGSFLLGPARDSTADDNYGHAALPGGAPVPMSRVQADVLTDHGMHLVGPNTDLFTAINFAGGFADSRAQVLAQLGAGPNPTREELRVRGVINAQNPLNDLLKRSTLNQIARALNSNIRILQPDGKMVQVNYAGALMSLVWIDAPQPYYRMAI
jgi:hypothetical protein